MWKASLYSLTLLPKLWHLHTFQASEWKEYLGTHTGQLRRKNLRYRHQTFLKKYLTIKLKMKNSTHICRPSNQLFILIINMSCQPRMTRHFKKIYEIKDKKQPKQKSNNLY